MLSGVQTRDNSGNVVILLPCCGHYWRLCESKQRFWNGKNKNNTRELATTQPVRGNFHTRLWGLKYPLSFLLEESGNCQISALFGVVLAGLRLSCCFWPHLVYRDETVDTQVAEQRLSPRDTACSPGYAPGRLSHVCRWLKNSLCRCDSSTL